MSKDIIQSLFESALNHYTQQAVIECMNFIESLSEDDMKDWTQGMSPTDTARFYRVWRATKKDESKVDIVTVPPF